MAQARVRPAVGLGCDRNELTSFTGEAVRYSRNQQRITITIHTDADTTESFELKQPARVRYQGEEFGQKEWSKVESSPGKLRPGTRATVWVCEGGPKTLDWEPPKE